MHASCTRTMLSQQAGPACLVGGGGLEVLCQRRLAGLGLGSRSIGASTCNSVRVLLGHLELRHLGLHIGTQAVRTVVGIQLEAGVHAGARAGVRGPEAARRGDVEGRVGAGGGRQEGKLILHQSLAVLPGISHHRLGTAFSLQHSARRQRVAALRVHDMLLRGAVEPNSRVIAITAPGLAGLQLSDKRGAGAVKEPTFSVGHPGTGGGQAKRRGAVTACRGQGLGEPAVGQVEVGDSDWAASGMTAGHLSLSLLRGILRRVAVLRTGRGISQRRALEMRVGGVVQVAVVAQGTRGETQRGAARSVVHGAGTGRVAAADAVPAGQHRGRVVEAVALCGAAGVSIVASGSGMAVRVRALAAQAVQVQHGRPALAQRVGFKVIGVGGRGRRAEDVIDSVQAQAAVMPGATRPSSVHRLAGRGDVQPGGRSASLRLGHGHGAVARVVVLGIGAGAHWHRGQRHSGGRRAAASIRLIVHRRIGGLVARRLL